MRIRDMRNTPMKYMVYLYNIDTEEKKEIAKFTSKKDAEAFTKICKRGEGYGMYYDYEKNVNLSNPDYIWEWDMECIMTGYEQKDLKSRKSSIF